MANRFSHIAQLIDDSIMDVFIVDISQISNSTLDLMRAQAEARLDKSGAFTELDSIFTTGTKPVQNEQWNLIFLRNFDTFALNLTLTGSGNIKGKIEEIFKTQVNFISELL